MSGIDTALEVDISPNIAAVTNGFCCQNTFFVASAKLLVRGRIWHTIIDQ